ncbi:uncharacterized protein LOC135378270 [Ornithodoros turicata]|uniref:uncharacterized protein LOC135378270 n=1 Tax=Ornithodoros turicata TaxID=34597 RepID=UPI0031387553
MWSLLVAGLIFTVVAPSASQRHNNGLDEQKITQDLLDLKLLGLRLETKLTILESLVSRVASTSVPSSQCPTTPQTETEVATSDTQQRILRSQQAIIDISNRNAQHLEDLRNVVLTQTSHLANRSDLMIGLIKSELVYRRPQVTESAETTSSRRHNSPVDRHNLVR